MTANKKKLHMKKTKIKKLNFKKSSLLELNLQQLYNIKGGGINVANSNSDQTKTQTGFKTGFSTNCNE
jgi:hypothetical protein